MAKDVRIIPASGEITFSEGGVQKGRMYQLGNDIYMSTAGSVYMGDGTPSNLELGDASTAVDITFLGGGTIKGQGGLLTIGSSGDTINLNVPGVTYNLPQINAHTLQGYYPSSFAGAVHNHSISSVTGLQTALDGKQPVGSYATAAQGAKADTALQSIAANSIGASELNVSGNGTTTQYLRSDGDGSFSWVTPPDTNTTYSAGTGLTLSGTTFSVTAGTYAAASHNHDSLYVKYGSTRLTGDASQILTTSIYPWDISTASDAPSGTTDGILTTGMWDWDGWGTQLYHDFHSNTIYIRSRQNSAWQTSWATVYTTDNFNPSNYLTTSGKAADSNLLDGIDSASFLRSDANDTFTGALTIVGDIRGSGQQLVLNAGESYAYATGQTDEYVYINAEQGLMVTTTPDNWGSLWAGRQTTIITGSSISVGGNTVWHTGNFNPASYLLTTGTAANSSQLLGSTWTSTNKTVRWDGGYGYHGNPRSMAIGYSGGNYGQFGYGLDFTSTSNVHTYAIADVATRVDMYGGLIVFGAPSGTVGTNISWTETFRARYNESAPTFKGNTIWHAGNDGAGSGLDADTLDGQQASAFAAASHTHSQYATLASPALTGTPTAPTATAGTNTTQIATTAFVSTAITNLIGGAPGTLDTLNELAAAINDDANYASTLTTALSGKLGNSGAQQLRKDAHAPGTSNYHLELFSDDTGDSANEISMRFHQGNRYWAQIRYRGGGFRFTSGNDDTLTTVSANFSGNLTGNVTGNVSGSAGSVAWGNITGTPSSFTPSAHNQAWSTITSTPTTLAGYGITDAASSTHTHTFASLTSKHTTLSGYGITDAATSAQGAKADTALQSIAANSIGASQLNVSGNGTTAQYLRSDGDGSFSWVTPPDTNTTYSAGTGLSLSGTTFSVTAGTYAAASHTHDDRYYTESEVDSLLGAKQGTGNYSTFQDDVYLNESADTDSFLNELYNQFNAFRNNYVTLKCAWSYAGNSDLDTGTHGVVELAGCIIECWGNINAKHVRITRPTTGAGNSVDMLVYNSQYTGYSPGWTRIWNDRNDGAGSGLDADTLDGLQATAFASASHSHTFASLTSKPTTLSGYGITDAATSAQGAKADTALQSIATNSIGASELNVTGNGTTAQYLRSDGDGSFTWATPPDTNTTYSAGTGLTLSGTSFSVNYGTSATTACVGNDARLSDARTPTAHTQAWSTITSTPTTLSGYGITDAASSSHNHDSAYAKIQNSAYYVEAGGTTGNFTASVPEVTALYDGLTLMMYAAQAFASYNYMDLNGFGAKQIYLYDTSRLTTHYPRYSVIRLVYNSTKNGGCWFTDMYYDSTDDYRIRWQNNITFGAYTHGYQILLEGADGKFYPVTEGGSTGNTNTVSTAELKLGGTILYYASSTDRAANYEGGGYDLYSGIYNGEMEYWNNVDAGWAVPYRSFYFVGTVNGNGNFVLDNSTYTSFLTQDLPTTEDGKVYVQVGIMNNNYDAYRLNVDHPIYEFKDGKVRNYIPEHTHTIAEVTGLQSALDGKQVAGSYASSSHTHTFASLTSKPTTLSGYGITDAASSSHTHTFASLTSKPTTLSGYGITDAATSAQGAKADTALQSIASNSIGATQLNVTGNGTTAQYLRSDGDGSFTWATPTDTNTTYSAGTGLTLSGTTFSVNYGTSSTTACVGNDSRLSDARTPTAHTHSITDISDRVRLFNNMGSNHATYQDFNSISNYGSYFIQGSTNGPGTSSSQFYGMALGLGNDYAYGSYAMQLAIPRYNASDKYISFRTREAGTWGGWTKASSGYADSAATASNLNTGTIYTSGDNLYIRALPNGLRIHHNGGVGVYDYKGEMRYRNQDGIDHARFMDHTYWTMKLGINISPWNDNNGLTSDGGNCSLAVDADGKPAAIRHQGPIEEVSDARQKVQILPITNALEKVKQINGSTFYMKSATTRSAGVIAQDVLAAFPEASGGSEDTAYTVNYNALVGLLMEAVKEQQATIEELQTRIQNLENK